MLGHRTLNAQDYLNILKRRWWIIAIPMIVFTLIAVGTTYFITPRYVSESVMLIDQQKVPTDFVQPLATQDLDSRLAIITEQVLSRANIQPIIEKYNLFANQHLSMDQRIDLMRDPTKTMKIEPVQSTLARSNGLPGFKISFAARDPQTAQQVCAEITSLFTKTNLQANAIRAESTSGFLKEQLDQAKQALDDTDAKVAAFQRQYVGMLPEDQNNNMGIMSSLNTELQATTQQLQNLQSNRSVAEAMLSQQQAAQAAASTPSASPLRNSETQQAELDALMAKKADLDARYSPDYPDVKEVNRKIADLQRQIEKAASAPPAPVTAGSTVKRPDSASVVQLSAQLRGIDSQIEAKRKEQDQIQQQIRSYEGRISASPQIEAQYKELTRDNETELATYNKLLAEMNQSQMTTSLEQRQEGETFSVLDAANLPTEPIYPKQSVFAAGGFAFGLALGLGIVALLEYRDTALRTERDVWDFTQLPTLAVIAWSGDIADTRPAKINRLKRLFGRKPSKELLADSTG